VSIWRQSEVKCGDETRENKGKFKNKARENMKTNKEKCGEKAREN
jgi:hypothetical protein